MISGKRSKYQISKNSSVHKGEHCVKSVCIQSFSGPYFPAFGLNTERYTASSHIQSECWKIWTRKTLNTDTLHAVEGAIILRDCIH